MKTELHKNLTDDQILNVNRQITPNATLFYVEKIGKYCYAGDAVCFPEEKPEAAKDYIAGILRA